MTLEIKKYWTNRLLSARKTSFLILLAILCNNGSFAQNLEKIYTLELQEIAAEQIKEKIFLIIAPVNCIGCLNYISSLKMTSVYLIKMDHIDILGARTRMEMMANSNATYYISMNLTQSESMEKGPYLIIDNEYRIDYETLVQLTDNFEAPKKKAKKQIYEYIKNRLS